MNAPIHYSDDTLIDALTTCMNISQAAKALGVSRGWLFPHAKRLEREGRILPKSIMPAYFKPKETNDEIPRHPPSNSRVDTMFNTMLKRNLGRWAEYRSYEKRTTANATAHHIRKHITAWTEPNVDYAAVTRRKTDGTYAVWVSAVRIKENDNDGIE